MEQRIYRRQTPVGVLNHQWVGREKGDVERQAGVPKEEVLHLDAIAGMSGMVFELTAACPLMCSTKQHTIRRGEGLRRTRNEDVASGTLVADLAQDAKTGDVESPGGAEPRWHSGEAEMDL